MRLLLLLPSVLLLNSCVLGPDPGSPQTPVPSSIRGDQAPHGTSFGDQAWRRVFTDSTLHNLIARALKNNPDLVAGVVVTRFTNAGDVSTRGIELDFVWRPAKDLNFVGGLAYTDAQVDAFKAPPGAAVIPAGTALAMRRPEE